MRKEEINDIGLEASKDIYKTIFKGSGDGILVVDAKTKKFVLANSTLCKITGYSEKELLGLSVADIHPKKDLPYVIGQFTKQAQGKITLAKNIPVLRKDKNVVYCDINSKPIKMGKQELLVGFFRDVTERKKAEQKINYLKQYNENILESNPNPIIVLKGKQIEYVNKSFIAVFGKTKKDYVLKNLKKIMPFKIVSAFEKVLHDKNAELGFKDRSFILNSFTVTKAEEEEEEEEEERRAIIMQDITERKKAEEKYKELFDGAIDAIFIADPATRQLIDCNKSAEKLLGYSRDKILSMRADELHPKDNVKETMEGFEEQREGKITNLVAEVLTKYNKRIPVSVNASNINMGGKNYLQGIFRDISKEKEAEEKIKEQMSTLQRFKDATVDDIFELKNIEEENKRLKKEIEKLKKKR